MTSPLNITVIGIGHLGLIHSKLVKESEYAKLIGVYDIDRERALNLSRQFDLSYQSDMNEAISIADAVIIAAPTVDHYEIALKCIAQGKHCLIEKPITAKYSEAQELIKKAKERGILVQVGHVERFNPAISALKGYEIKPLFIEAHRLSQFRPRAIDVSVIHDLMIHDIDIVLWFIKSPVTEISANGVAVLTDTIDIANARLTFQNGAVANLTASRISAKGMRKMRVFQNNAYLSIDFSKQVVEVFRLSDESEHSQHSGIPANMLGSIDAGIKNKNIYFEKPVVEQSNAIAEEQKAFVESILENIPIPVAAEDAAEALRIAEIINEQMTHPVLN
ncbi:MAG: hypothetical protein QG635_1135 [Bacteroidota bacterium]|nr:hypothetical protein [Bacteroidota bacterium]